MLNTLLPAHFYKEREQALRSGPGLKFNGATEFKLRVIQVISLLQWSVTVEWMKEAQGSVPGSVLDVPDVRWAFVEGGALVEIKSRLWDADKGRVVLLLEQVERVTSGN